MPTEAAPHPSQMGTMGRQVKSAVSGRWGQGGGRRWGKLLIKPSSTGGTEKISVRY